MFGWKSRRKTSKSSSSSATSDADVSTTTTAAAAAAPKDTSSSQERSAQPTTAATAAPTGASPPRHRRRSLSDPGQSAYISSEAWNSDDAAIGITNVSVSSSDTRRAVLLYEISLCFPSFGWRWVVHRSYAEFIALHRALEPSFGAPLQARKVRLPRAARLSWESFRASVGADATAATKLLAQLNTYLHKLLAIEVVHTSAVFRAFLTPRADSLDTACFRRPSIPQPVAPSPQSTMAPFIGSKPLVSEPAARTITAAGARELRYSPRARTAPLASLCDRVVHFGSAVSFAALGGLQIGLTRRSALSGSQKAVAVAAGVAGVALTGPLSAVFALGALGGGMGKYQMNKACYLSVTKPRAVTASAMSRLRSQSPSQSESSSSSSSATSTTGSNGTTPDTKVPSPDTSVEAFLVENAERFSGPRRAVKFGDLIHLYCESVRKSVRIAQPPDSKRGHFMVTNTESSSATLRLVSPYGYTGTIVCGSQVYIQVVNSAWAGEFMGVHGEFISSGKSPTVFKVTAQDHACADGRAVAAAPPHAAPQQPFTLRVMAYNVWLMPGILSSFNGKLSPFAMHRARAIPLCLRALNLDVVVFCEAFCSSAREALVAGMKEQGFLYETKVVGAGASMSSKKAIDGGCFAMSKYPIDDFQELTFGSVASGDDRMADKGVVYFSVRVRDTESVHVFGTHLQAWETPMAVAARANQLQLLRAFMDSLELPRDDAVLVVGDLNVNKSANAESEYASMLEALNVVEPALAPHSSAYSFDPFTNDLAVDGPSSSGETERLDYVLVAQDHRAPMHATSEIVQLKATSAWKAPSGDEGEKLVDLSDHYPVVAELRF